MTLKEEMEKAVQEGTTYIPPYKLKEMTKVSSKIVDLLGVSVPTGKSHVYHVFLKPLMDWIDSVSEGV